MTAIRDGYQPVGPAVDLLRVTPLQEPTAAASPLAHGSTTDPMKALLLYRRQALIIELGAIEDYLGISRSIVPRRKRDQGAVLD